MITISLINMKGGVGKTTLAVNLAWHLTRIKRKKVLLVDLDPQFNASQYMMNYQAWDKHRKKNGTIADILLESKPRPKDNKSDKRKWYFRELHTVETPDPKERGLWIIPSDLKLAKAVKNPQGVEYRLKRRMEQWSQHFDYAFIDCAPGDTVLTATALMSSDFVLVPIKPDPFSIVGYSMMQEVIDNFRYDYPDPQGVQDLGVVFTQVGGNSEIEEQCKNEVAEEASYIFQTEIKASKSYLRSVRTQEPVFHTQYARLITKQNINMLSNEMEIRINSLL